jgi:hypothetical protein
MHRPRNRVFHAWLFSLSWCARVLVCFGPSNLAALRFSVTIIRCTHTSDRSLYASVIHKTVRPLLNLVGGQSIPRYTAIRNRQTVDIEIILAQDERQSLQAALATDGFRVLDAALEVINSRKAEAAHESDLRAISDLVTAMPGGFRSLDDTVRSHLRGWFEDCGVQATPLRLRTAIASRRWSKRNAKRPSAVPHGSPLSNVRTTPRGSDTQPSPSRASKTEKMATDLQRAGSGRKASSASLFVSPFGSFEPAAHGMASVDSHTVQARRNSAPVGENPDDIDSRGDLGDHTFHLSPPANTARDSGDFEVNQAGGPELVNVVDTADTVRLEEDAASGEASEVPVALADDDLTVRSHSIPTTSAVARSDLETNSSLEVRGEVAESDVLTSHDALLAAQTAQPQLDIREASWL